MTEIETLKEAARVRVAHLLPNTTFQDFDDLNARMLIAVTLLQRGEKELAYELFATIASQGPQENENRHFAYVRSLVEMAELDAEWERFAEAEARMAEGVAQFPESMNYMMSRTHLQVYLSYYRYRLGRQEEAHQQLEELIQQEEERFRELPPADGSNLVGPGLCYALHQRSLFFVEEGEWQQAVETFRRLRGYASYTDEDGWKEAESLAEAGKWEAAYNRMVDSTTYDAA
ncbi:hypothetical protein [Desmospora activa]|uniref:Tetratricopeptide repeat protein n=1 Tax=Desmospora activa DSM 45169 TaxID=1121389 RepID=A0A2T4ZD45_9BACL|nr:hypothetical protein [Desmospora activa]PTM59813.1 hypothetical protein C8J48_2445 [Desmospora activa DSM 45169]